MYLFDNLGRALRWLRDRRDKKQYEVAEAAGITKGMLCAYETGKQRPSLETLDKLLHALDADLSTLQEALALVGRYGALQVAESAAREGRDAYPLPASGSDVVSDGPPQTLGGVLTGLGVLVSQLLEVLRRLPETPGTDPSPPKSPASRR